MEKSGREMSRVLGKASRHTIAIGKKIDKQTAKIARLRTKIGATSTESLARSARKIAHSAAADFDSYCEEVSGLNSRFAHLGGIIIEAIRGLSEHQPGWVSDKALAEINDLHTACTGAKVGLTPILAKLLMECNFIKSSADHFVAGILQSSNA